MRTKAALLIFSILCFGLAQAQQATIIKVVNGGKFGLVKQDPVQGFTEGDPLKAVRHVGAETIEIGEVTVIRCQGDGCAVKLTHPKDNRALMVGDELSAVQSNYYGTSNNYNYGSSGTSDWKLSLGVTGRASSLGFGGELGVGLHPKLGLRIGYHSFSYSYKGENTDDEYTYQADAKLKSMYYLLDWFPLGGSYHLTFGLVNNLNVVDLTVTPTGTYTYGSQTYQPDEIGILTGKIDFDKNVPYVGFGWGSPGKGTVGFVFDIGIFYQKSPHVTLVATEMLEPTAEQDGVIAESLKGWKVYGVVSFGLKFRVY